MSLDRLWVRDSNGNPVECDSLWIRNQGLPRRISDVWVRNSNGTAEKVYPNPNLGGTDVTDIVVMNQGTEQQMPSLRFDQKYGGGWSTGMEDLYRDEGVKFGLMGGVEAGGGSGSPGTLVTKAQANLTNIINAFNNKQSTDPVTSFNWDWGIGIDIANKIAIQAVIRGGGSETDLVPSNYQFLNRSGTISNEVQQVINTVIDYNPTATSGTITYQQLHNSCKQSNIDIAEWARLLATEAKIMNLSRTAASPIPFMEGWWNNNDALSLVSGGYPQDGLDAANKRVFSDRRTTEGESQYLASGGSVTLPSPTPWSYGLGSFPFDSYQARAYSLPFEMCSNSNGIQSGVDCVAHQSYFPVYPSSRTLDDIPNSGYTSVPNSLTHGFDSEGLRYTQYFPAREAVAKTMRQNWLANWKRFGSKASVATELSMDFAGYENNRFNGLAVTLQDYQYMFVDPVVERLTQKEAALHGFPSVLVGRRLMPRYWVFWNNAYYFLSLLLNHSGGEGRDGGPGSNFAANTFARLRSRENLRWRFSGGLGSNQPPVDWTEGSNYHGWLCLQLDYSGWERIELVRLVLELARNNP